MGYENKDINETNLDLELVTKSLFHIQSFRKNQKSSSAT